MSASLPSVSILVVEDEEAIRTGLCDVLAYHGHAPHAVASGPQGLAEGLTAAHALIILDVMLPDMDGFEVCRRLRERLPHQAILLLTARGTEEDVLRGFRCGADDYVVKPFSVSQLVARVEALLRRAGKLPPARQSAFAFGPWTIEPASLQATRDGEAVALSRLEAGMLALLARNAGRIVGRRALLQEVWGFGSVDGVHTRTVDMHVARVRKKLGDEQGSLIETIRGEGYRHGAGP